MSPHAIDDDSSGWAQQQRGHDDNGGQDDEDNNPDIQNVLGEHDFHGDLADGIHAASLSFHLPTSSRYLKIVLIHPTNTY